MKAFDEIFIDETKYGVKVQTSEYRDCGKYVIIDQGQNQIAGYTDREEGVFEHVPVIIFGDHTRIIKYIDEPFFLGADGVKVLSCKDNNANYKYLYYALKNAKIPDTGYNRHFKWLRKICIKYPDVDRQKEIVIVLDMMSDIIKKRKKEIKYLDDLIKARFVEMFGDPVSNPMGWEKVKLSQCLVSIDNGKSFVCGANSRTGNEPAILKLSAATYGYYKSEENKAMIDMNQFVEDAEVHSGDLLFTRKNTPELVGMCAYVYDTPAKLMMPDLIFRLNTSNHCDKIFLWKLIDHDLFRACIGKIAAGSAKSMSNISKERLLGLCIILPPIELQQQFADFVRKIDKLKLLSLILRIHIPYFCSKCYD